MSFVIGPLSLVIGHLLFYSKFLIEKKMNIVLLVCLREMPNLNRWQCNGKHIEKRMQMI
ncbi:MAG: hypothetical protein F6K31_24750 [Symploca sp. SIO2G7]|nr:hypothetical protein [Symploca sp. SIO2G7]